MFLKYYVVVLFFNFIFGDQLNSFVEVRIRNGIIRGENKLTLLEQKEFNSFRGIPYAKPPLNHLRFLPPETPDNWDGVLDTLNYKSECIQFKDGTTEITGDEDCLYVNVFSPIIESDEKLPVMLFTHGGAFITGSGGPLYGPDFLVEKGVILVTFNYRLSVFGFLSLNDDVYSGNMGLKDHLLAMKWVNKNIEYFNGDPKRVTLFGQSAGAIMSHFQALSPDNRNLFQRVILLSGTAFYGFAVHDTNHRDAMFDLAKKEQIIDDFDSLIHFLQTYDSHKLFYKSDLTTPMNLGIRETRLHWSPVIEPATSIMPIITDYPENTFETQAIHDYDIMIGFTSHETLFLVGAEAKNPTLLEPLDQQFEVMLPDRHFRLDHNSEKYKEMADEIREFYFGNDAVNNDTFYEYIQLYSDAMFAYGIDQTVRKTVALSSGATYYFIFSVDARLNAFKQMSGLGEWRGAGHGDELAYALKCHYYSDAFYKSLERDSIERQTIDRVTTLFTNFAKYGNPTPNDIPTKWKPVTTVKHNFLNIGNDGLSFAQNPNHKYFSFWDNLFEKYKHYAKTFNKRGSKMSNQNNVNKNNEF